MDYHTNAGKTRLQVQQKIERKHTGPLNSDSGSWKAILGRTPDNRPKPVACSDRRKKEIAEGGRTINPTHVAYVKEEAARVPKTMRRHQQPNTILSQGPESSKIGGQRKRLEAKSKT